MTVNILGSDWKIIHETIAQNKELNKCDGYCDWTMREIHVRKYLSGEYEVKHISITEKTSLRHEIIHAFLCESGLWVNTSSSENWSMNEEMIDWIARQMPKIWKACKEANAI
jgi:hypothetical protein